jgi:Ca2+-binding RTX toxin-like protein
MSRRARVRVLAILGTFATAALWAGSAEAATVSVSDPFPTRLWRPLIMTYEAAPGETNRPQVVRSFAEEWTWLVSDPNATITAGDGCASIDAHMATCSMPADLTEVDVRTVINLGDMDDSANTHAACGQVLVPEELLCSVLIDGGPGDDSAIGPDVGFCGLEGGPGEDRLNVSGGDPSPSDYNFCNLDGGPGSDFLWGAGRRKDTVLYSDRVNPVSVNLERDFREGNGEAGEDDVIADVPNVETGSGADVVIGDSDANLILTGAGSDTVRGGGGNDEVFPGAGGDRIWGGEGRDQLVGGLGGDTITAGPGRDFLAGEEGNDTFYARDRAADTLWGGPGHDRARIDVGLDRRSSIERLF